MNTGLLYKDFWTPEEVPFHEVVNSTDTFQTRADFFGRKYIQLIEFIAECFSNHPTGMGLHKNSFCPQDALRTFILEMKSESENIGLGGPFSEIFFIVQKLWVHSVEKSNQALFFEYIAPSGEFFVNDPFSEVQSDRLFGLPIFTLGSDLFDAVSTRFGMRRGNGLFYVNPKKRSDYFILLRSGESKPLFHEIGHSLLHILKPHNHDQKEYTEPYSFSLFVNEAISVIGCDHDTPPRLEDIFYGTQKDKLPNYIHEADYNLRFAWMILMNRKKPCHERLIYALYRSSSFDELQTNLASMCLDMPNLLPQENTNTSTTRAQFSEIPGNETDDFLEEVFITHIHVLECLKWIAYRGEKSTSFPIQERKYPTIFCFYMWKYGCQLGVTIPDTLKDALVNRVMNYPGFLPEEHTYLASHHGTVQVIQSMNAYLVGRAVGGRKL